MPNPYHDETDARVVNAARRGDDRAWIEALMRGLEDRVLGNGGN